MSRLAIPIAVFAIVAATHCLDVITCDSRSTIPTARSLLRETTGGANTRAVYRWNSEPVNVDAEPSRVWDWRDPPFLCELWPPGGARRG